MRDENVQVANFMFLILFGVLAAPGILIFWAGRRLVRRLFPDWFKPVLLLIGFGFIFWFFQSTRGNPNRAPAATLWSGVLVASVVVVAFVTLGVILGLRNYDAGVHRAQKRAAAGDLDGAIEDLREQIEDKGPTQGRVNVLGILLLQRNQWDEAAVLFRKAEELGGFKGVCRANLGAALLKGGKPEEALPVLQEAARIGSQVPGMACLVSLHTANALAALGRWDEARAHWLASETAVRALPRAHRDAIGKDLEQCRLKLEEGPYPIRKPEGLEEL